MGYAYIDMHCDTLMQAYVADQKDLFALPGMVDFQRMQKGGALAQFFAVFMPPPMFRQFYPNVAPFTDESYFEACAALLKNSVGAHSDRIALAHNAEKLMQNHAAGKMSAFLTIEDGRMVNGKLEQLERFYKAGVRAIGLTWNHANCFGFPNSTDAQEMAKGLTAFGKEAVQYMQELGILVDVSHLSDGGFYDVASVCKKPFIATHSNCRAVSPHPRNLTDDMIRVIAQAGGVIGMNFGPEFLNRDITCKRNTAELIVTMATHMKKVGGIDVVAFGSDFDGMGGELEIDGCDKMPQLGDALEKAGFTPDEIEKIFSKNILRVLRDAVK